MEINKLERANLLKDYAEMMEMLIKNPFHCYSPDDYNHNHYITDEMFLNFIIQSTLDLFKIIKDANFDYIKNNNYQDIYQFASTLKHELTFIAPSKASDFSLKQTTNAIHNAICHQAYRVFLDGTIEFDLQEINKAPFIAKTNISFIFGLALEMTQISENFELIEPFTNIENPTLNDIGWQRYYGRNQMNANPRLVKAITGYTGEYVRKSIKEHIYQDAINDEIRYYTFDLEDYEQQYIAHTTDQTNLDLDQVNLAFNKISRINWRNQFLQKYYLIALSMLYLNNHHKSFKTIEHQVLNTDLGHYLLEDALYLGIKPTYLYDFYQDHQQNINYFYSTYLSFIFTELDSYSFSQLEIDDISTTINHQYPIDYLMEKLRNCFTHGRYAIDHHDIFYLRDHANGQHNEQDPNFSLNLSRDELMFIASIVHQQLEKRNIKTRVK